ncbi:Rieske (2Fe-2S) protein [Actinomycetospora aeridis]|uniref:Rieske (2Fe-2S) protein n=1 Tax=Actinomycetospora aeridis TaxID=3129231 RepID=A0ABU8N4U8_9PSEU
MTAHAVARLDELPPGTRKIVEVDGRSIGVFNVGGRLHALRNTCPHQGAPLCLGTVGGTMADGAPGQYVPAREGEILTCPWHGWEFDLTTGRSLVDPARTRVRAYEVTVDGDAVILHA